MDYTFQTRWADMDPNQHLRHSAYADYAAHVRVKMFADLGYPLEIILKMGIGPVLFREDIRYLREVRMNENIRITCKLSAARKDASRWHFLHEIFNGEGELCATIHIEGAWLDLVKRKLTHVPDEVAEALFKNLTRTENFTWLPESKSKST